MNTELYRNARNPRNGKEVTYYGLCCGYDQRAGDSWTDGPWIILFRDTPTYHLKGIGLDGKFFWETFEYLKDARRAFYKWTTEYERAN